MSTGATESKAITLETLERWLATPAESEHLEFKEAKQQFDWNNTLQYCVALANEGGGCLVLGVTDKRPRRVVGSRAFENTGKLKQQIFAKLGLRVDVIELKHAGGRVVVLQVPSRPAGQPVALDGAFLMRIGEALKPMSADQLKRIFSEGAPAFWSSRPSTT